MYFISLLLGYELAFTEATLTIGRSIRYADSRTGFQDAITPPWSLGLAIAAYVLALGGVVYGFIKYDWLAGIGILAGFFFVMVLNKVIILPKKDSEYFRRLITRSMIRRHADYLRDGDELRASAVKMLLERLDIPVSEFISELKNDNGGQ
jgi:hypothetical protein